MKPLYFGDVEFRIDYRNGFVDAITIQQLHEMVGMITNPKINTECDGFDIWQLILLGEHGTYVLQRQKDEKYNTLNLFKVDEPTDQTSERFQAFMQKAEGKRK